MGSQQQVKEHNKSLLLTTSKIIGHFTGFRQLIKKLEQITSIRLTLQEEQKKAIIVFSAVATPAVLATSAENSIDISGAK